MSTEEPRDAASIVFEAAARRLSGHGPGCDCAECESRDERALEEVRARAAWWAQATPERRAAIMERDRQWLKIASTTPAPPAPRPEP